MMLRRTIALSATLALGAAAAPIPLAHAVDNATFTKKANAACAAAGAKVEALPRITGANLVAVLRQEIKILSSMTTKLDAITPPSAKRAKYQSFLANLRKQVTLAKQTATAVERRQVAKAKSLAAQIDKESDRGDALARAMKLRACAKTYSPSAGSGSPA